MKTSILAVFALTFLCVGCGTVKDPIDQKAAAIATSESKSIDIDPDLFNHCPKLEIIKGKTPDDLKTNYESWTTAYIDCASHYDAQSKVIQKAFKLDSNGKPLSK